MLPGGLPPGGHLLGGGVTGKFVLRPMGSLTLRTTIANKATPAASFENAFRSVLLAFNTADICGHTTQHLLLIFRHTSMGAMHAVNPGRVGFSHHLTIGQNADRTGGTALGAGAFLSFEGDLFNHGEVATRKIFLFVNGTVKTSSI